MCTTISLRIKIEYGVKKAYSVSNMKKKTAKSKEKQTKNCNQTLQWTLNFMHCS